MPIPAKAFQRWLHGIAPDASTSDVCRAAGIKRSTLAQQLVRGKVAGATVVSVSRAYNINPVTALAGFDDFRQLAGPPLQPTRSELVSQISTADLLRALLLRGVAEPGGPGESGGGAAGVPLAGRPDPGPTVLVPPPHATSVRDWVEAIDDGELRHRVSTATGIAPQNYSAQLTANRLTPELALATALAAGVAAAGGLVATGLITEAEAGWPPGARQAALDTMTDGELTTLAGERLQTLGRALRRQEHDQERTDKIWENLG
jgi:transposase-like protein